jgi:hypothetical protein
MEDHFSSIDGQRTAGVNRAQYCHRAGVILGNSAGPEDLIELKGCRRRDVEDCIATEFCAGKYKLGVRVTARDKERIGADEEISHLRRRRSRAADINRRIGEKVHIVRIGLRNSRQAGISTESEHPKRSAAEIKECNGIEDLANIGGRNRQVDFIESGISRVDAVERPIGKIKPPIGDKCFGRGAEPVGNVVKIIL